MCKKTQFKYCPSEIDECMKPLIRYLKLFEIPIVACCCGHGIYPMTIVIKLNFNIGSGAREIVSNTLIPRDRKFYKKDKNGYYYIPEVSEEKQ